MLIGYLAVFFFGCLSGFALIANKYREAPGRAAASRPGLAYILVNGALSCAALWLIGVLDPLPGDPAASPDPGTAGAGPAEHAPAAPEPEDPNERTKQALWHVIAAGFGALVVLRTRIKLDVGENGLEVGPGQVLDSLLRALDQEVSRSWATTRARLLTGVARELSLEQASVELPMLCIQVMRDDLDDKQLLGQQIGEVREYAGISNELKVYLIAIILVDTFGMEIFQTAKSILLDTVEEKGAGPAKKP